MRPSLRPAFRVCFMRRFHVPFSRPPGLLGMFSVILCDCMSPKLDRQQNVEQCFLFQNSVFDDLRQGWESVRREISWLRTPRLTLTQQSEISGSLISGPTMSGVYTLRRGITQVRTSMHLPSVSGPVLCSTSRSPGLWPSLLLSVCGAFLSSAILFGGLAEMLSLPMLCKNSALLSSPGRMGQK